MPIEGYTEEKKTRQYDYVTLIGIPGLVIIACVALYLGESEVASAVVGGIAGVLTRLYK